jgi:hypothetical protein
MNLYFLFEWFWLRILLVGPMFNEEKGSSTMAVDVCWLTEQHESHSLDGEEIRCCTRFCSLILNFFEILMTRNIIIGMCLK